MKKQTRKQIIKKLDKIFSQYIRISQSDEQGIGTCVSCGKQAPWKELQCGHYFNRSKLHTRWDEDNCHIQCKVCNVFKKGNYPAYAKYMYDSYDKEFMEFLEQRSNCTDKIPTTDLEELIKSYKHLVKEIQ